MYPSSSVQRFFVKIRPINFVNLISFKSMVFTLDGVYPLSHLILFKKCFFIIFMPHSPLYKSFSDLNYFLILVINVALFLFCDSSNVCQKVFFYNPRVS